MKPRVFISYAREDGNLAENLHSDLQALGFDPWLDKADLQPGERWQERIRRVIQNSDFFLALLSRHSIEKKGFVQRELKLALDVLGGMPPDQVFIMPVRLEDCDPLDFTLGDLGWVDLFPSYEDGLEKIARGMRVSWESRGGSEAPGQETSSGEDARDSAVEKVDTVTPIDGGQARGDSVVVPRESSIGCVFVDIVGFTRRNIEIRFRLVEDLNKIVLASVAQCGIEKGSCILLPTGDGICIAIVEIFSPVDLPLKLACRILEGIHWRNKPLERDNPMAFNVRVGVEDGRDAIVLDINSNQNVAGRVVSHTKRVMDAAGPAQIFVGSNLGRELLERKGYKDSLRRLRVDVKHAGKSRVYQFVDKDLEFLDSHPPQEKPRLGLIWSLISVGIFLVGILLGAWLLSSRDSLSELMTGFDRVGSVSRDEEKETPPPVEPGATQPPPLEAQPPPLEASEVVPPNPHQDVPFDDLSREMYSLEWGVFLEPPSLDWLKEDPDPIVSAENRSDGVVVLRSLDFEIGEIPYRFPRRKVQLAALLYVESPGGFFCSLLNLGEHSKAPGTLVNVTGSEVSFQVNLSTPRERSEDLVLGMMIFDYDYDFRIVDARFSDILECRSFERRIFLPVQEVSEEVKGDFLVNFDLFVARSSDINTKSPEKSIFFEGSLVVEVVDSPSESLPVTVNSEARSGQVKRLEKIELDLSLSIEGL